MGYLFVGILVVGVVMSIAELRYANNLKPKLSYLLLSNTNPPVHSFLSAEESSATQRSSSTRPCPSPRAGT